MTKDCAPLMLQYALNCKLTAFYIMRIIEISVTGAKVDEPSSRVFKETIMLTGNVRCAICRLENLTVCNRFLCGMKVSLDLLFDLTSYQKRFWHFDGGSIEIL